MEKHFNNWRFLIRTPEAKAGDNIAHAQTKRNVNPEFCISVSKAMWSHFQIDENEENSLPALREMLTEILWGREKHYHWRECGTLLERKERKKMRISGASIWILTPRGLVYCGLVSRVALFGQDRIFRRQGIVLRSLGMTSREWCDTYPFLSGSWCKWFCFIHRSPNKMSPSHRPKLPKLSNNLLIITSCILSELWKAGSYNQVPLNTQEGWKQAVSHNRARV